MLQLKTTGSYLYAGLAFSIAVLACPDPADNQYYKSLNGSDPADAELMKRWYTVTPSESTTFDPSTWSKSTIPYCFEDDNSKTQLKSLVKSAWKVWQTSGVNARIDMRPYINCPDPVGGLIPKGPEYLLIKVNNLGNLHTTVGHQLYALNSGPSMDFDPSPAVGMRDPIANMVHEIGHAWGFYHEQQRQSFWDKNEYTAGSGVRNQIIFTCSNLRDYATVSATLDGTINDACHSAMVAKGRGFSALDYLPTDEQHSSQLDFGDYDWDSVMLYASKIGGVVTNGAPAVVWVKNDGMGTVVDYNKTPSQRDVERFMAMYTENAPWPNPCLIRQGCNPAYAAYLNSRSGCKKKI